MALSAPTARRLPLLGSGDARLPRRPATGRALERRLLLLVAPVALLGAFAVSRSPGAVQTPLAEASTAFGIVFGACVALHILLSILRFDGDPVLLPTLALLLLLGTAYHLGLRTASGGTGAAAYMTTALVGVGTIAAVVCLAPVIRRLSLLFEEKVWWKLAGDLPYYESAPFHLLLFGLMLLLVGWLLIGGRPSGSSGAIVMVPLLGKASFTPSEFVRLAVAFFLADYLSRHSRVMRNLRQPVVRIFPLNRLTVEDRAHLVVLLVTVLLYCAFFVLLRDFGPAAIIFGLTLVCLYAATQRWTTPLILLLAVVAVAYLASFRSGAGTFQNRLAMWWNPWDTNFLNGDHQARILWGIASGGWLGIGSGVVNLRAYLPEAGRDTAFAGIATTMGVWVALAALALFACLAWRGYRIARAASTDRGRLLAFSLSSLLALQAVWICGAMVGYLPFSGINLPFVSTGLSSVIASGIAVGALLNLSRTRQPDDGTEATDEVLTGVRRVSTWVLALFAIPAAGLLLYGAPPLLGDRTLTRTATALGRERERVTFANPYLEQFRRQFPRGRVYSADGELLAVTKPDRNDRVRLRERNRGFLNYVDAHPDADRVYPLGRDGALLIGWTTQGRFAAKAGSVETAFDALLRGYAEGELPRLYRNRHNPLLSRPRPHDLHLTVDARVQRAAHRRLRQAMKSSGGSGGAIVVLDANTGQVLAAATEPAFDPNGLTVVRMQQYVKRNPSTQVLVNKALARDALYFPGSTFKLVTTAAALEDSPSGGAACAGRNARELTWQHDGTRFRRPAGRIGDFSGKGHGSLDLEGSLERALTASCNVFFATLATRIGVERMSEAMRRAELAEIPSPDQLAAYLPEAGFGQVVVKTAPIELAMLAGAAGVATNDEASAARPYWVGEVVDGKNRYRPQGQVGTASDEPYRPFPTAVARRLREMMLKVVNSPGGTAYGAFYRGGYRLPLVTVGGKTGTAEFEKLKEVSGKRVRTVGTHAWFMGFARSDREAQPRTLAYAVLVEDVRGRQSTGGHVCAPAARDLLIDIFGPYSRPEPEPTLFPDEPRRPWWEWLNPRTWF